MKKYILTIVVTVLSIGVFAQSNVILRINHKLNSEDFAFNTSSTNNMDVDFNVDRIQYYLSSFKLIHDGGVVTDILNTYALVDGGTNTEIDLGMQTVTNIESVEFSVGVDQATNHLDPAQYAAQHPLAPQNPSMHWGWTSGYRFVAMEGNGGSNLSTGYEIHALGDNNYLTTTVDVYSYLESGNLIIEIDADYAAALKDIDVSSGVITHGSTNEAVDLLNNFQMNVFKAADTTSSPVDTNTTTGIFSIGQSETINVYPNPSQGLVNFSIDDVQEVKFIRIYDQLGALVEEIETDQTLTSINIKNEGLFYIAFVDNQGFPKKYSKVLVK